MKDSQYKFFYKQSTQEKIKTRKQYIVANMHFFSYAFDFLLMFYNISTLNKIK